MLLSSFEAMAQGECDEGVVFGLFNGVQTLEADANLALKKMRPLYGANTPKGDPIAYDLFYNDTQGFADFVETFDQRLNEHGSLLAGRFELFFSAARGEGFWWKALTLAIPSLVQFLDDLFDLSRAALMRELTASLGSPSMGEVAARHRDQIDLWTGQQKKMLFFAHSQGNLFVNRAYAHAASKSEGKDVRVVHVAPASPTLSGAHTLADKDMVINGLRLIGAVVANTTEIPPYMSRPAGLNGKGDLIGHGLLEIYLNPALATAGRIREHVLTALRELDALPSKPMPPFPDFVASPWEGGQRPWERRAPLESTHRLEKVTYESTAPQTFVWTLYGWSHQSIEDRRPYTETWTFWGPGMGGQKKCEWAEHPYPADDETLYARTCTYDRVPWDMPYISLANAEELRALPEVRVGTEVSLTKFTIPAYLSISIDVIRFFSGYDGLWNQYERRYWQEPYRVRDPHMVLNEPEIRAWDAAYEAYRQEDARRYDRHLAAKAEYEEKRRRCAAPAA